jgi:hypothetical protein
VAHVIIQPKKGKKITYDDLPGVMVKEHGTGLTETHELGIVYLTSKNTVDSIPLQERIEPDGSRRYYAPLMLDWAEQFTKKEFNKRLRNGEFKSFYGDALKRMYKRMENKEFIPAEEG